jgi:hypothetical protein
MSRSKTNVAATSDNGQPDVLERDGLSAATTAKGKLQRIALNKMFDKQRLREIPTSIRFVFYELEQAGLQSKRATNLDGTASKRVPTQNLTEALTHLRNNGLIPWDWIVDESRDVTSCAYADSVRDYLIDSVDLAEIDRFPNTLRPVLLCESRGVGGVLSRGVARDYCVDVCPTGGNCNGYLRTKVAPFLKGQNTKPLYIGDHDLAGNYIEDSTRRILEDATGRSFAGLWERIMLTDKQCEQLRRKGVSPIQKKDRRFKDGHPHEAFEVEALGQSLVTQIIRDRLEELAPEPLERVREREVKQRAAVIKLLNRGKM